MGNIRYKRQMFDLWNAGKLGFKLRTWDTPEEAVLSGVPLVGFRQIGTGGGGKFVMATAGQIVATAKDLASQGIKFQICEAAPDEKALCQGEVIRTIRGLEGYLTVGTKLRMRDAIAQGLLTPRTWLETEMILRANMWPSSREDLDCLLDTYPGHVVEFTCYNHRFEPGRNTIFWEVRNY